MKQKPDFSLVFPIMNQEDHIEKVVRSYHQYLTRNKFSFELIGVVNGTSDKSFQLLNKLTHELANVHAYEIKKGGYGRGVLYGLTKARGKYLCYFNSARIHPDELILCLKYFLVNPDVILHGVRKKRDAWYRKITSFVYTTTCKLLFNIKTADINGNPNIMSRVHYNKLKLSFTDSMIDLEMHDKAQKNKIPIIEVPVFNYTRHGGQSTSRFNTSFRLLKEVFAYCFLTRIKK